MEESPAAPFGRLVTAMATPFHEGGALDIAGAVVLARHLVANGSDALVLTGSTGESSTLTDTERIALWEAVAAAVAVPVIAGSTSNDTAHAVELTRLAERAGVAAILAVTPYYNRPSQAGLEAHFRAVAASTSLPVILYDIPVRTGRKIAEETILRLVTEVDNIVGVKDSTGDAAGTARLIASAPSGFFCYAGDDAMTLPLMAVGAVGLISVAAHWCGPELAEMIVHFEAGEHLAALAVQKLLLASFAFESGEDAPNPVPTKAMLRVLGLPSGQCRLPLGDAPAGLEDRAKTVIADLEQARVARSARG